MSDAERDSGQHGVAGRALPRIGLLAADALRIAGLRSILGDRVRYDILALAGLDAHASGVELVLIDGAAHGSLWEMLGACRRMKLAAVVLGEPGDAAHIERVIGAGAKGYLSHKAGEDELRQAIEVVRDGSIWAPRKVLSRLLERSRERAKEAEQVDLHFTPREAEVLRLLVMGYPNRQIAEALGVDQSTVKAHMGRLMRKAGVGNRTALGMRAIERGWT